jgi:hypothetical protein
MKAATVCSNSMSAAVGDNRILPSLPLPTLTLMGLCSLLKREPILPVAVSSSVALYVSTFIAQPKP